jgi:hypothetical protein
MNGAPSMPARPAHPIRRLAAIALIFLVVGPPIGAILMVGGTELVRVGSVGETRELFRWIVKYPVLIFGMGYVIGGLPAVFAGLLVGARQVFYGGATWLWALASGLAAGVALVAFLFVSVGSRSDDMHLISPQSAAVLLVCVLPTFACWAIVRALDRTTSATAVGQQC